MRILLSNDDGCQAPGLRALHQELALFAEVVVVAPDRNRSGHVISIRNHRIFPSPARRERVWLCGFTWKKAVSRR